jgi:hypothetical protein
VARSQMTVCNNRPCARPVVHPPESCSCMLSQLDVRLLMVNVQKSLVAGRRIIYCPFVFRCLYHRPYGSVRLCSRLLRPRNKQKRRIPGRFALQRLTMVDGCLAAVTYMIGYHDDIVQWQRRRRRRRRQQQWQQRQSRSAMAAISSSYRPPVT